MEEPGETHSLLSNHNPLPFPTTGERPPGSLCLPDTRVHWKDRWMSKYPRACYSQGGFLSGWGQWGKAVPEEGRGSSSYFFD